MDARKYLLRMLKNVEGFEGGDEREDRKGIWYLEVIKSNEWHSQAEALGAELWFAKLSFLFAVRLVVTFKTRVTPLTWIAELRRMKHSSLTTRILNLK